MAFVESLENNEVAQFWEDLGEVRDVRVRLG